MFTINIIGAGRLGKTLGKLIVKNKVGSIQGICNQSLESSLLAAQYISEGDVFKTIEELPSSDITFVTTADGNIKKVAYDLSSSRHLKQGSVILHCSGVLSSSELNILKSNHCKVASVHPMHSFASPDISISMFKGTYCAMEGDEEAKKILAELFESIGGITYSISSNMKVKYHVAGVIASNYLVTLCNQAHKCLESTGVDPELSMKIITSLMRSTTQNLSDTLSAKNSLTGPVKRGDKETLLSHLDSIKENKELINFYRMMGLLTVDIANHSEDEAKRILNLFCKS